MGEANFITKAEVAKLTEKMTEEQATSFIENDLLGQGFEIEGMGEHQIKADEAPIQHGSTLSKLYKMKEQADESIRYVAERPELFPTHLSALAQGIVGMGKAGKYAQEKVGEAESTLWGSTNPKTQELLDIGGKALRSKIGVDPRNTIAAGLNVLGEQLPTSPLESVIAMGTAALPEMGGIVKGLNKVPVLGADISKGIGKLVSKTSYAKNLTAEKAIEKTVLEADKKALDIEAKNYTKNAAMIRDNPSQFGQWALSKGKKLWEPVKQAAQEQYSMFTRAGGNKPVVAKDTMIAAQEAKKELGGILLKVEESRPVSQSVKDTIKAVTEDPTGEFPVTLGQLLELKQELSSVIGRKSLGDNEQRLLIKINKAVEKDLKLGSKQHGLDTVLSEAESNWKLYKNNWESDFMEKLKKKPSQALDMIKSEEDFISAKKGLGPEGMLKLKEAGLTRGLDTIQNAEDPISAVNRFLNSIPEGVHILDDEQKTLLKEYADTIKLRPKIAQRVGEAGFVKEGPRRSADKSLTLSGLKTMLGQAIVPGIATAVGTAGHSPKTALAIALAYYSPEALARIYMSKSGSTVAKAIRSGAKEDINKAITYLSMNKMFKNNEKGK